MNTYNGIPISEHRLLIHCIVFTVMLIATLIVIGYWGYLILSMKNKKEEHHIQTLKEKARNNELAKKRLEKLEKKIKRRKKRNRRNNISDVFVFSVCICIAISILFFGVIPGWTDYLMKDYVVYTGEIKVYVQMKNSRIELEDGITVWGRGSFDDDTYGTVVYSKRTKRFLGGSN